MNTRPRAECVASIRKWSFRVFTVAQCSLCEQSIRAVCARPFAGPYARGHRQTVVIDVSIRPTGNCILEVEQTGVLRRERLVKIQP